MKSTVGSTLYQVWIKGKCLEKITYNFSTEKAARDFFTRVVKKVFETTGAKEDNHFRTLDDCIKENSMIMGKWMQVWLREKPLDPVVEDSEIQSLVYFGLK